NPLAALAPVNVKADLRHERGALSGAEFDALIRATRAAGTFRGLSGGDRAALYLVAAYTGLRAAELASLTPASFDLDSATPKVRVRACYTKNGDPATLPLRPDLAGWLRAYLAGKPSGDPVWPGPWWKRAAFILRHDLGLAGVPYLDAEGRFRDFHSL